MENLELLLAELDVGLFPLRFELPRHRFWTDQDEARLFKEHLPELEELYHWIPSCRLVLLMRSSVTSGLGTKISQAG